MKENSMKTIWKQRLDLVDEQIIFFPIDSQLLCVQIQQGNPYIWALVDSEAPNSGYSILQCGTGHPTPDSKWTYLDTYQLENGIVLHVFYLGEKL